MGSLAGWDWDPSPARLSAAEREEIRSGLDSGESFAGIGRRIGRATSTVSREVNANGGRDRYQGWRAHRRACDQARRHNSARERMAADRFTVPS